VNERRELSRSSTDTTESLLPESAALASRRLGWAAALSACVDLIYTILYRTVWVAESSPIGFFTGLSGLFVSGGVAAYLLTATRSESRVAAIGVGYQVFLAFALSLADTSAVDYDTPSAQVSWSAVVIVLFPFLIPARSLVVFVAATLSAAMTPLALVLAFGLSRRPWPEAGVLASYLLPPFFCAILAWAPAQVLNQLKAALRRARRLGSYELRERLGAGGMGEVWRASHRLLARPAAVKLIRPEVLGARSQEAREDLIRRFEREAQVTASLESPHTVELYDFGVSADGVLFYVMELLHGVDLDTLIERFGPLPCERVVHLLAQACDSLEDAHACGLIHRDIKPANLFVSRKGGHVDFLKILDFGLVKRWSRDEDAALSRGLATTGISIDQTASEKILGTPAFLAPEMATGEQSIDHRADLYALGCVGYWMLTGEYVFSESSVMGMAVAHVTRQPEPPSKRVTHAIVPELEAVLMSCLEKDREARPKSAAALRQALEAVPLSDPWTRERAHAWWQQHLNRPIALCH
jgi:serine/threonine-protein kinase